MRDFDDFFSQKLNEESSFPHRARMWKEISRRLDAFDAGVSAGGNSSNKLTLWKTVAAVVLVACGILGWKYRKACDLTQQLQREIAGLQEKSKDKDSEHYDLINANKEKALNPIGRRPRPGGYQTQTATNSSPARQSALLLVVNNPNLGKGHELGGGEINSKKGSKQDFLPPNTLDTNKNTAVQAHQLNSAIAQSSEIFEPIKAEAAPVADTATLAPKAQPTYHSELAAPSAEVVAQPTAVVSKRSRYRVGLYAVLGSVQPRQRGVSNISGHGLQAEYRVLQGLWAIGAIDWVHHEVSTTGFFPKFHYKLDSLPKPPPQGGPGPKPTPKLARVESSPRDQHFQLGIRYELPWRFWARPSVRLAHTWVRRSPSLVTFKFEEPDPAPNPGPPKPTYLAEKFDTKWIDNQWRIGIGLEKDIPQWAFSLWAEYSKNMSAPQVNFDALYLRAGAQYRF